MARPRRGSRDRRWAPSATYMLGACPPSPLLDCTGVTDLFVGQGRILVVWGIHIVDGLVGCYLSVWSRLWECLRLLGGLPGNASLAPLSRVSRVREGGNPDLT